MKIYEEDISIDRYINRKEHPFNTILNFSEFIYKWRDINYTKNILKFVILKTDYSHYRCSLLIAEDSEYDKGFYNKSIFTPYGFENKNENEFNTVLLIPTGINCEIGGHAGDANSIARLIASNSDTLITHPNVVNASDINELPSNGLYVEGSIINRLMMGQIGLKKVRSNKILLIMEEHENEVFNNEIVNTVSAARTTGIDCDIYVLEKGILNIESHYVDKRPSGRIENIIPLLEIVDKYKHDYDAFAITTNVKLEENMHNNYFNSNYYSSSELYANPWGNIEAMLTHTVSHLFNVPSAHAPVDENEQISKDIEKIGIVDPRKAAETYSATSLYCVLKGLYKAPKIIDRAVSGNAFDFADITVRDISCMIIPDGCLGLTILATMGQKIPIIVVKENKNLMSNGYTTFKDNRYNNLIFVDTYIEAVGVMQCLKEGISLESVKRPLEFTKILNGE